MRDSFLKHSACRCRWEFSDSLQWPHCLPACFSQQQFLQRLSSCTCRLLMLYKIQSGLAHCPTLKAKLVPRPSRQRRTHDKQLTLLNTRTQYRGSSFFPKTIRDWNSLPMKVVEAPTLTLLSQGYQTEKLPIVPPPPQLHPSPTSPILIPFMPDQYYSEHPQL